MTIHRKLQEQGTLAKPGSDGVVRIRIITEGVGSTGVYRREMLEANADAFPAGTKMFIDHPDNPQEPWTRPLSSIAAKTITAAEYAVVEGEAGLWADAKIGAKHREFIEEFGDVIGVSVFIAGDGTKEDENGKLIVESFMKDDPYASIDFVIAAGRGGRVERAAESLRVIKTSVEDSTDNGSASAVAEANKKRFNMEEAVKALLEAFATKINGQFVALEAKFDEVVKLSESSATAKVELVDALDVADKLAEAKLSESGRKRVVESITGGLPVADAILAESKLRDEYLAEANIDSTGSGRTVESAKTEFTPITGWSN